MRYVKGQRAKVLVCVMRSGRLIGTAPLQFMSISLAFALALSPFHWLTLLRFPARPAYFCDRGDAIGLIVEHVALAPVLGGAGGGVMADTAGMFAM